MNARSAEYLSSLPGVQTSRMPLGTIFFADGQLYQVIEAAAGGYHKARQWRQTEATDVALIPNSFPSRFLPVVDHGFILPTYTSRRDLMENDLTSCYVFPTEALAMDAAHLDADLVRSPGAYVRAHVTDPAYEVTDGAHAYRLYYFRESVHGRATNLSCLRTHPRRFQPRPHTDGPGYWTLLSTWTEYGSDVESTQPALSSGRDQNNFQNSVPHHPNHPEDR